MKLKLVALHTYGSKFRSVLEACLVVGPMLWELFGEYRLCRLQRQEWGSFLHAVWGLK